MSLVKTSLELAGIGAVAGSVYLYRHARTGHPLLDRPGIRANVVARSVAIFGPTLDLPRIVRLAMSIVHNESRGDPRHFLGDLSAPTGPAIGPMQVTRVTAKDLGLYVPPPGIAGNEEMERQHYASLRKREGMLIGWGLQVLRAKMRVAKIRGNDAGFDLLASALRRYNGGGPMAEGYRNQALTFARVAWGDDL